jgi:RES domain-containing protein
LFVLRRTKIIGPDSYKLLKIDVADGLPYEEVFPSSLSNDWKNDETETQAIGDAWLEREETALLRVPSAITPETWNWVLNPRIPILDKSQSYGWKNISMILASFSGKSE